MPPRAEDLQGQIMSQTLETLGRKIASRKKWSTASNAKDQVKKKNKQETKTKDWNGLLTSLNRNTKRN